MAVRKSTLRRRAEHGPGSVVEDAADRSRDKTPLGRLANIFGFGRRRKTEEELWKIPLPDLLSPAGGTGSDPEKLIGYLDLAFLGRASAGEIDRELDAQGCGRTEWEPAHFANDLFLPDLVRDCLSPDHNGRRVTKHRRFIERVLETPPTDLETIRYRQTILRELAEKPELGPATDELLLSINHLLTLLRASRDDARLEPLRFRFDVLRTFRSVVVHMADAFEHSTSGLQRLTEVGNLIRATPAFERLEALLDHHDSMATLEIEATVGDDGRLRHLEIRGLRERRRNPFFRRPLRRWLDRFRAVYHRYSLRGNEIAERLVMGVFREIAPAMARVVQLTGHLEVYASSRSFAAQARARGLHVCLPLLGPHEVFEVEGLFNPLLLGIVDEPVPSDLSMSGTSPINLITGPNSGGKTRLLQAIGITQVLAQSGLYAPCRQARLPLASSLFASIVEFDRADQAEGRLGTEMMRLRTLFQSVPPQSVVLLDELCSGTNPSEAIEIVEMVLRLLRQLDPIAFVTTHFLDFAEGQQSAPSIEGLSFLQAEVREDQGATFRFIPGVATTSLAVGTARRLGVTFEELEKTLEQRVISPTFGSEEIGQLPPRDDGE